MLNALRLRLPAVSSALIAVVLSCSAFVVSPASNAAAFGLTHGGCITTATVTFSGKVTTVPQGLEYGINGHGTCASDDTSAPVPSSFSFVGAGGLTVDCGAVVGGSNTAGFLLGGSVGSADATSTTAGTAQSQVWVFVTNSTFAAEFEAVGIFIWSNANEQAACAGAGTSTMSLTGVVVWQDPPPPV